MRRRDIFLAGSALGCLSAGSPLLALDTSSPPQPSDILTLIRSMAGRGWQAVFAAHGIDLSALDAEGLARPQPGIDRSQPGFEDFCSAGNRLIEPGDPGRSLLYHALASPNVCPADLPEAAYPSLAELDQVENAIYAAAPLSHRELARLVPIVFAYQYRPGTRTPHARHADMVFSRTAIGRIGSEPDLYEPRSRSFSPRAPLSSDVRVLPARLGVFLARKGSGVRATREGICAEGPEDYVPVRKLFDGDACLPGRRLSLRFSHWHVNDKLAKGVAQRLQLAEAFDLTRSPFHEVSTNADGPVEIGTVGSSCLVRSKAAPMVVPAVQDGRYVLAEVGPAAWVPLINRRYTSRRLYDHFWPMVGEGLVAGIRDRLGLQSPVPGTYPDPRNGPEFVNIRHRSDSDVAGTPIADMRDQPADRQDFLNEVAAGDYKAVLFKDGCAMGAVTAVVDGLDQPVLPAFSVVTAPDFFPYADQLTLQRWIASKDHGTRYFRVGGPDPLCFGDLPPSPEIRNPLTPLSENPAFDPATTTMVALVSAPPRGAPSLPALELPQTGFLPDSATNVFAPGWDVTYGARDGARHYTTSGLGSPFPEDVKLCAAANAMWPAVSPDASRTFAVQDEKPTAIPMMDGELGLHPRHPEARGAPSRGWDGEYGPFLTADGAHVDYADIERSDYVANLIDGQWDFHRLAGIDNRELSRRMDAYARALDEAQLGDIAFTRQMLISAKVVDDWSRDARGPTNGMTGSGYRFLVGRIGGPLEARDNDEVGRRIAPVDGPLMLLLVDDRQVRVLEPVSPGLDAMDLYS